MKNSIDDSSKTYDPYLISKVKEWLGEDGISFFRETKEKHGKISAVYMDGRMPHPVHFREGMQVRNFIKQHVDWDQHKLDNEWDKVIEGAIK